MNSLEVMYVLPIVILSILVVSVMCFFGVWILRFRKTIYIPQEEVEMDENEVRKILVNELLMARDQERDAEDLLKQTQQDKTIPQHKVEKAQKSLKQKTEIRQRVQKKLLSI